MLTQDRYESWQAAMQDILKILLTPKRWTRASELNSNLFDCNRKIIQNHLYI